MYSSTSFRNRINGGKRKDGPVDICYCSSKGKLIPWEKYYYYSKDNKIIENKGKFCSAKGDKCIQ